MWEHDLLVNGGFALLETFASTNSGSTPNDRLMLRDPNIKRLLIRRIACLLYADTQSKLWHSIGKRIINKKWRLEASHTVYSYNYKLQASDLQSFSDQVKKYTLLVLNLAI